MITKYLFYFCTFKLIEPMLYLHHAPSANAISYRSHNHLYVFLLVLIVLLSVTFLCAMNCLSIYVWIYLP